MKYNFLKGCLSITLLAFMCSVAQAKTVIKVGSELALAPFSYLDNGQPVGFEVDLMNEIAAINDWEINHVKLGWKDLFVSLEDGRTDLVVSSLFKNPEREETYALTVPYLINKDAVMYMKSDIQIQSDEDLSKLKIAGIENGRQSKALVERGYPKENLVPVKTVFLGFKTMASGKADAVISHELVLKNISKNYPGEFKTYVLKEAHLGEIVALAKKGNQTLVDKFNQALAKVKADGKYAQLEKKWGID